ncbi:pentatricopeptide repeat-containing protein At2g34400 [Selaginella moellendorffii]|uniref:pentatricopeptide repeat-containing protein At2g34400 n=1 Tax=Selaginella moellendorffii TaxID=88036 RepID=UPI000D1C2435|nr:pentatricopeptide repeat-containing protein At2g34400 [Selaginella moellendorffii]|eukprot:XP_024545639.1 pentatricopeptide repeat-containing protein At2g34400 [Selaginella moellendorffii]
MAPGRARNPQFLVAPRRAPSDGRFATAGASRMASRFHSLKLMRKHGSLENLVSAAAIRTVVKPYMQDALKEHSVLLEKNLEVLSLRRLFSSGELIRLKKPQGLSNEVYRRMQRQGLKPAIGIVVGALKSGNGEMALQLFAPLGDEGYKPDRVSVPGALKACSSLIEKDSGQALDGQRVVFLERSREIHRKAVKLGLDSDLFVASTLIDLYAKCGSLTEARRVFEGMSHRSVVTWNCMILGYASSGEGGEALDIYARMRRGDTPPDALTFIAALKACCRLADEELAHAPARIRGMFVPPSMDRSVVYGEEETEVLKIQ